MSETRRKLRPKPVASAVPGAASAELAPADAGHAAARGAGVPPQPYRGWPALKAGDRVALFSPSSHQGQAPADAVPRARDILARWGLRPAELTPERRHLYLAGTDRERAEEFERLYLDPGVRALFCTRGGYGAARILPLLDRARIAAAPPKAVVGFSDVTSLFTWLHWAAGISVVHGPCLAAPSALSSPDAEGNLEALRRMLFDAEARPGHALRLIHRPPPVPSGDASAASAAAARSAAPARAGAATGAATAGAGAAAEDGEGARVGRLVGGCLAVLVTSLGTPWAVDTRGAILFLEDTDEAPYRVDRMLTHLRAAGRFDGLRALVFGHMRRCDGNPPGLLEDMLRDLFHDAPFPVAVGLPAGHGDRNLPLPLGRLARLDFEAHGPVAAAQAHLQVL